LNNEWHLAMGLGLLGFVARDQGHYERAAALCSESLALFRKVGDKHYTAWALRNFGLLALRRDDPKESTAFCRESLTLSREIGDVWLVEGSVMVLAGAAALEGRYGQATRLFAAAEGLRKTLGRHRSVADQADYDKRVASSRAKLGDRIFSEAWAQGTTMTLEEAVGTALAPIASLPAEPAENMTGTHTSRFTPREREVVGLVARGLSNREIAARLVISERTVDTHVQHILNKLGVDSRVQITAWAVEQGLHTFALS
jgi:non-specific serine/threonine protein kinase